jgi:O-glycosyl hydrolase
MDLLRGRAVHIHDELVHADAAAYFAMNSMWDSTTHREHYKGRSGPPLEGEADTPVLIYNEHGTVRITGTGYAIGHYARWIRRGAVRLEADSSDPLVAVTAFRDDSQKRFVLVAVNNSGTVQPVAVELKGLRIAGMLTGEQSTEQARWQALEPLPPDGPAAFTATLPAFSVTTLAAAILP